MACSQYEYVKKFEISSDVLLPNCWLVVRIDGKCFHQFSKTHKFEKPNDWRALVLMNRCALSLCKEFPDIVFAIGQSDEYSFVLHKGTKIFGRRSSKIQSLFVSHFTSCYVFFWKEFMETELLFPPVFDSRVVCYPSYQNIRDYISWRQVDCHINNLYNTCFWTLVLQGGLSEADAEAKLNGTLSSDKNELLFSRFQINYNDISPMFRKGSILYRASSSPAAPPTTTANSDSGKEKKKESGQKKEKKTWVVVHEDVIGEEFWKRSPEILSEKARDGSKCFGAPPLELTPYDPLVIGQQNKKRKCFPTTTTTILQNPSSSSSPSPSPSPSPSSLSTLSQK